MNEQEIVDIYDASGQIIEQRERTEAEAENLTIPNAIVFIFTPEGKVWLQQRADWKKHYPGLWDTTACGAIAHGEDSKEAAERELLEESSLRAELALAEKFLNTFPNEDGSLIRNRISYLYIGISEDQPKPNPEVKQFALFEQKEILTRVAEHPEEYVASMELELQKAFAAYASLPKIS